MRIELSYGHKHIPVSLPDRNTLEVEKTEMQGYVANERKIILEALENPINSETLAELARGKKRIHPCQRCNPAVSFIQVLAVSLR